MAQSDEIRTVYRRALLEARRRGFSLNRSAVDRLYAVFADALVRISEESEDGTLDQARADAMRRQIEVTLEALQRELVKLTGNSVAGTARDVAALHEAVNRELARRYAGPEVVRAVGARFVQVPLRAVQVMVARGPAAASFQTLIARNVQALGPEVDTFLGAAVARGVSAGRAAKDLAKLMAGAGGVDDIADVRAFETALRNISTSSLHRGAGTIDYSRYGLTDHDTAKLRKLLYDARRIQVTETNNALRESNAESMRISPIVSAAHWQLSGAHPEPDVCDMLAETDAYGYGPGYYPPDKWPVGPHPHCGCMAGAVAIRPPEEWARDKPASRPLGIDPRDAQHTERWSEEWSEKARERYQQVFATTIAEAEAFSDRVAA